MKETLSGYTNLEMSLETGKRGGRVRGVTDRLCALVGLKMRWSSTTMRPLFYWPSVRLHKGEMCWSLVESLEIGGSFRVPDIIETGGAQLWRWVQPIEREWVTMPRVLVNVPISSSCAQLYFHYRIHRAAQAYRACELSRRARDSTYRRSGLRTSWKGTQYIRCTAS